MIQIANAVYEEVVFWRKTPFKLPSGAAGKNFLREVARLMNLWTDNKPLSEVALNLVMVMPALLLQKPSRKSNAKQHSEYLAKRLSQWQHGQFNEIMIEARAIQQNLKRTRPKNESPDHLAKSFSKLMMNGKVNAALRLLDQQESLGVATLTEETLKELKKLHPDAEPATNDILMSGPTPYFDPIMFQNIDEGSIAKAATRTKGAAGPSGLDANGWRRMLISKNFGTAGKELRTAIANFTRSLCTIEINDDARISSIEAYVSNRLIPLEKSPSGIRPIGIGEVLRRIVGKAIVAEIRPELQEAAGSLQLCAGQKAGCEAAAHAMRNIFQEEDRRSAVS